MKMHSADKTLLGFTLFTAFVLWFVFWSAGAFAGELPDATLTPGAFNPAVTQANIEVTICKPGWTKTIRPPASYTNKLKAEQLKSGVYQSSLPMAAFEEDHLASLQLGGSPTDPRNLYPQPYAGTCGARKKDRIETRLKELICSGKITLVVAQHAIATDWVAAYNTYIGVLSCQTRK